LSGSENRESSLPYVTQHRATDPGNLSQDILDRLGAHGDDVALRRLANDAWLDVTLTQFHTDVINLSKGLIAAGVGPGDRVALLSATRYEWTVADYAIWWIGAATVPVYESSSVAQISWVLQDSGAIAAIVETESHLGRVEQSRAGAPELRHVWCLESGAVAEMTANGASVSDAGPHLSATPA